MKQPTFNLPDPLTSFVGREDELNELERRLLDAESRLIALMGLAGAGKTRLAIQAARNCSSQFPDGVHYVALRGAQANASLEEPLLQSLGVTRQLDQPITDQLMERLASLRALLLLDNFEDCLGESELLIEILQGTPHVKIMLTTQERIHIRTACVFLVGGLPYGEPDGENQAESAGVKLFLGRARHSRAGFLATSYNLPYILRICELVGGLPLGIELAAAALREQRSEEIVRRLQTDLSVLATSMQDLPPAHRSMQAALTPAWKRLSAAQQEILRSLASLDGEFEAEALEVEAAEMERLADLSWLERRDTGSYRLHPLARLFVKAKPPVSVQAPAQVVPQAERLKAEIPTSEVFWDRLEHLLERAERYGQKAAVLLLRLEEYPGTTQAREAQRRLKGCLRRSDTVTRLEKGLFGILLEDISNREDSLKVALKLRAALNEPETGQGWIYPPKVQIGISLFPEDGREAVALVGRAKEELLKG